MRNAVLLFAVIIVLLVAGCAQRSGDSDQDRQGTFYGGVSGGKTW